MQEACDDREGWLISPAELESAWPVYGPDDEQALLDVLRSGRWSRLKDPDWRFGPTGRFETELGAYLGGQHVLSVVNGTEAIDIVLRALGIGEGDEVLVQASTFFGSVTPILRIGAVPVFVDIEPGTYTLDHECLRARITPRTVAVVAVHLSGLCSDMDDLVRLCSEKGLALVEDCAQALGSQWKGRALGTLGNAGCYSFQQEKVLTAGEGGAVVSSDRNLIERAFAFHQGFTVPGSPEPGRTEVSTNLRISPFLAAILRCQLKRLDEQIDHRNRNFELLCSELHDDAPLEPVNRVSGLSRWCISSSPMRFVRERASGWSRDSLLARLQELGVPCFEGHYDPLYRRSLFADNDRKYCNQGCPESERIANEECLTILHSFFSGPPEWTLRLAAWLNAPEEWGESTNR